MGTMISPVAGRVSSEWSKNRKHPVTGRVTSHAGIDIAAPVGTDVVAAFGGRVISVRKDSFNGDTRLWKGVKSGNHILIKNTDDACQYYGHLSEVDVSVGDTVVQGQKIGEVGQTGVVTGPHLHLETWSNDNLTSHFNPRILFQRYSLTPGSAPAKVTIKPAGNTSKPSAPKYTTVRKGSRNSTVGEVQAALRKQGYTKQIVDNDFGAQTQANVKDFQKRTGLVQDGIAGPITQKRLGL
ncbi:peptidoglycan DD-metalloendopeptidase family protein [Glutamicibacter sp. NPDC087344]|uniref:peptidoglycan DD-metalloendopeptidase family protein n=1 Tax=Glutamicibacter sp. NPDC087344 TaxID=3363994 RepID=UPI0037FF9AB4